MIGARDRTAICKGITYSARRSTAVEDGSTSNRTSSPNAATEW
jgi:hypothetical protein